MENSVNKSDLKRLIFLQMKVRSTIERLEKHLLMNTFFPFEGEIKGWVQELEGLSWTLKIDLLLKGKQNCWPNEIRFKRCNSDLSFC